MSLIKNAITYKCDLPAAATLDKHLAEHPFRELGEAEFSIAGFVPVKDDRYVFPFPDGYCFRLRFDEKILPNTVIKQETNRRVAEIEAERGGKTPIREWLRIRDDVYNDLVKKALIQTRHITAFYRPKDRLLVANTASKSLADVLSNRLVHAVGSIKATTIYISGISNGLTSKLHSYLNGSEGLAGFEIGGVCKLKGEKGTAISVKAHEIHESKDGLLEALMQGYKVTELEIGNDDVHFRLNEKFIKKGIFFNFKEEDEYNGDDDIDQFQHDASCEMLWLANACQQLLTLFEYKEPVADQEKAA
ncbi:recombination-associated protein RdgC [Methylomonas sp. 2BW1-5-20]|uniref:recombination-associated protein RdgC n=1 Tax=Methylomonas sp. 2BW1-5-20 TaxID=3376686 RepID=UPI00404E12C5